MLKPGEKTMNNKKSRPPSPAEMLKNELEKRNLSQRALAEKLGERGHLLRLAILSQESEEYRKVAH